jgi:hypothetical protein
MIPCEVRDLYRLSLVGFVGRPEYSAISFHEASENGSFSDWIQQG